MISFVFFAIVHLDDETTKKKSENVILELCIYSFLIKIKKERRRRKGFNSCQNDMS